MNRRDTIKSLLLSSVAAGIALNGCAPDSSTEVLAESTPSDSPHYGRTDKEKIRDNKLKSEEFLTEHELLTIAVLSDIILPKSDNFGSATDAGVPEFIGFIVKDLPSNKIPLRGGLMWLDNYSNKTFHKAFNRCSPVQQKEICDQIAYPGKTKPELIQGEKFFTLMRNLTLTGYYTTKMGIDDLGYKGNAPNVWDGVPEDVLKSHNMSYDDVWLSKCVDKTTANDIAKWDDMGNLIS